MSLAAALEVSPLSRGAGTPAPAPRVLVVSPRDDLGWLLGPLADAGLGGATIKRTALPPAAEARPDLLVIDDHGGGPGPAWRRWLAGPGAGAPAVIIGGDAPADGDAPAAVATAADAGPGRLAAANATAFERGRAQAAHAQLALRASRCERKLTAFLEHSPETFGLLDRHGRITYAAPSAERVHGYPAGELVGKDLFALLHPDDQTGARARFQRLLAAPRAIARMTVRRRHPRGHFQWIEVTATNLLDEPTVAAVVASFHNVDERETAIAALRASEQRFQQLARELPIVLWSQRVDDGALEYVSPHAAVVWGWSVEHLLADPSRWTAAIHPDDRAAVEATARAGGAAVEYRVLRPDGSITWVEAHLRPVADERGRLVRVLGVARDVGARRDLDEQLDGARRRAALEALAGAIVAGGGLDGDLSGRLLDFVGRTAPSPTALDLGELVRRARPTLEAVVGATIAVEVVIEPALPPVVADAAQLERALVNLALNARDAMPAGGALHVAVRASDRAVVVTVADTGTGFDPTVADDAAAPFVTSRPDRRVGLGLTVVAAIVRHHRGAMRLGGAPGQGATVTIALPAA